MKVGKKSEVRLNEYAYEQIQMIIIAWSENGLLGKTQKSEAQNYVH